MGPRPDGRGTLCRGAGCPILGLLQWGRDRMAAERRKLLAVFGQQFEASMGPRPDGRGTRPADDHAQIDIRRFNGAATGWPRNDFGARAASLASFRFNGAATGWPRNAGRPWGRAAPDASFNGAATGWPRNVVGRQAKLAIGALQWGRDRMAAER